MITETLLTIGSPETVPEIPQMRASFMDTGLGDIVQVSTVSLKKPALSVVHHVAGSGTMDIDDTGDVAFSQAWRLGRVPDLSWLEPRHPSLTSRVRHHISILRAIVATKALGAGVGIRAFIVDIERDPEEDVQQVVLRTQLDVGPAQAIAFWKSLEGELDAWARALGERGREVLSGQVGLRFHWTRRS